MEATAASAILPSMAIVPVVVDGSYASWPCHQLLPKPGRIKVLYGPPLKIAGLRVDENAKPCAERLIVAE